MENATQALMIAAIVLIGILILTLGIYLFHIMAGYAEDTQNQMSQSYVAQFNYDFLKYDGLTDLTIQDVITVKNHALESNKQQDGDYDKDSDRAGDNNSYIDVYYTDTGTIWQSATQIIWKIGTSDETLLKEQLETKFTCKVDVNTTIGRVNKIYFYKTP